jgi:transcriptional regulator with XRE-family HTH domain
MTLGREIRVARYRGGMTQARVGKVISRSASWISLIEGGKVPGISVSELMLVGAAVGLKLHVTTFPAWRRPLDAPQLQLLNDFNARLHTDWRREIEKVMPREGDLRAADELISIDGCSCVIEAITRFADVQAQVRAVRLKARDLHADRLILLVRATNANRRMLREAGEMLAENFPILTKAALKSLGAGRDPGGNCLIVL